MLCKQVTEHTKVKTFYIIRILKNKKTIWEFHCVLNRITDFWKD